MRSTRTHLPSATEDNDAYVRAVHDKGLAFDLTTMSRRRMLTFSGLGAAAVLAGTTGAASADCLEEIESETNGPYPADGTNGVDVRTESGIVRKDITSSFGSSTTTADGVPLTVELTIQDLDCEPLAGAAVYIWQCDRDGKYSLYSDGITEENYLRGIQETNAQGVATFTSIVPACYEGRWPHIHFEVYSSVSEATDGESPIRKTSQLAFPKTMVTDVYENASGYSSSVATLSRVTLEDDNVFGDDDAEHQMATITGSISAGYTAALTAAIDPDAEESGGGGGGGGGGTPPSGGPGGPGGGQPSSSAGASSSGSSSSSTSSSSSSSTSSSSSGVSGPAVQTDGSAGGEDNAKTLGVVAGVLAVGAGVSEWIRRRTSA